MNRLSLFILIGVLLCGGIIAVGAAFAFTHPESPTSVSSSTQTTPSVTQQEEAPKTSFSAAKLGTVDSDIPYCTMDGQELVMDLYWPSEGAGPFPLAVYVHGGGWTTGDKTENMKQYAKELTSRGIVVAAVEYRLAPTDKFPAMIEDVKCAVRHLRSNAVTYNIDPERIGAFGGSAGGHIVNLLGTADASAGWDDVGAYQGVSSRVAAVVDLFGPTDLRVEFNGNSAQSIKNVFGTTDYAAMGFASPITYVTPDDPPFLVFHGEEDTLVPIAQSEAFVAALQKAGVEVTFVRVKNAGHSFRPATKGVQIDPSASEIAVQMAEWLVKHL
jgi:acetyl esterase/lipase